MLAPLWPLSPNRADAERRLRAAVWPALLCPRHLHRDWRYAGRCGCGADFVRRLPEGLRPFHRPLHDVGGHSGRAVLRAASALYPAGAGLLRHRLSIAFSFLFQPMEQTEAFSPAHAGGGRHRSADAGRAGGRAGNRNQSEAAAKLSGLAAGADQRYRLHQSGKAAPGGA